MRTLQCAWLIAVLLLASTWTAGLAQDYSELERAWPGYSPVVLDGRVVLMPPDFLNGHSEYLITYSFLLDGNTLSRNSILWDESSIGRSLSLRTQSGSSETRSDGFQQVSFPQGYTQVVVGISEALPEYELVAGIPGVVMPAALREVAEELSLGDVTVLVYHPLADTFSAELMRKDIPSPTLTDLPGELLPVLEYPEEPSFERIGELRVPIRCRNVVPGEGELWQLPPLPFQLDPAMLGSRLVPLGVQAIPMRRRLTRLRVQPQFRPVSLCAETESTPRPCLATTQTKSMRSILRFARSTGCGSPLFPVSSSLPTQKLMW